MSEQRKLRLTREALGDRDDEVRVPDVDGLLRTLGIIALVLFVVLFTGTYPT